MKNFVSFNIKAKKKCDADAMILHCVNLKARNKSDNVTLRHLTKFNVTSNNLHENYTKTTEEVEKIKGKAIQKNANHYLEGVLSFSYEQVYELGFNNFRDKAPEIIQSYGKALADEFGFEYLGFSLHFDEGMIELEEDGETPKLDKKGNTIAVKDENGKQKINIHAHLSFINFDKKTNKARFREIQQKYVSDKKYPNLAFVKMQDLAAKEFEKIGFTRGISKEITKYKHVEKAHMQREKELREKELEAETRVAEAEERAKNAEIRAEKAEVRVTHLAKKEVALKEHIDALQRNIDAYQEYVMDWTANVVKKSFKKAAKVADAIADFLNKGIIKNDNRAIKNFKKLEDENNVTDEAKITNKVKFKR